MCERARENERQSMYCTFYTALLGCYSGFDLFGLLVVSCRYGPLTHTLGCVVVQLGAVDWVCAEGSQLNLEGGKLG